MNEENIGLYIHTESNLEKHCEANEVVNSCLRRLRKAEGGGSVGLIIKLIRTAGDNLGKFLLGDKKYTGRRYGGGAITYSTIIFLAFMFYWLFYPSIAKEEKEEEGEIWQEIIEQGNSLSNQKRISAFLTAFASLNEEIIKPNLQQNKIIIIDRYLDSTLVYQGAANAADFNETLTPKQPKKGSEKEKWKMIFPERAIRVVNAAQEEETLAEETEALKEGYINDYISGLKIKATPEEIEAVQVFSKQLVEDYNYPKDHIQTRPQFRVKRIPSDTRKEYPIDIAVFSNNKKQESDIYIIVECKNKKERMVLRKVGNEFEEIPDIPRFKQRIEDIGKFRRKDLEPTHNLKTIFKSIRNYLAGNNVGATRDEVLAQQLINLIFCKLYDEKFTESENIVTFRAGFGESPKDVKNRILGLFEKVKREYKKDVFTKNDVITLDANSIFHVVGELQKYCLMKTERDVVADAFEIFIGHTLKGEQGQFFTPRNVVKMMLDWGNPLIESEKNKVASEKIVGIDKDYFLSKKTKQKVSLGKFNVLLTNPPFGSKIPVRGGLKDQEAPQILFIERCLQFLKGGGRMAIVLPDGILGNNQLGYVRKLIMKKARIVAVIDLPKETFQPNTSTKTSILILRKTNKIPKDYPVFMGIAKTCWS
ncbi:29313_t:CDS:10 [Racocetra persica]|uniref:29313_t:CDS:1 n=1 Tax=Racocetra persica TaxID=160502 RepID=A0ACA9LEB5_9GLOM|nr:29313_t:CDS:10 [Racocetra persica]